jgi:hypothetical protein
MEKLMKRVLFILKRRTDLDYGDYSSSLSTGLLNSSLFVNDMLIDSGIDSRISVVTDNNDIDREVTAYRPTHVIIEALWVVPEKFDILKRYHPHVKWIVRLHSEAAFLANEGMAMGWIFEYLKKPNVYVAVNSIRFRDDLVSLIWWADRPKILYMPNYYPIGNFVAPDTSIRRPRTVKIGCFGAIRPLKNQLAQAIAALKFADEIGVKLEFYVNAQRVEMKGQPVLRNLEAMFDHTGKHKLVKIDWLEHRDFLDVVSGMDMCLQVSFSETFNIVAADSVSRGIPTIVSREIPWAKAGFANPTSIDSMVVAMKNTWPPAKRAANVTKNQRGLATYSRNSQRLWGDRTLWHC